MDAMRPHLDELLESASHHIRYYEAIGDLPAGELSAEELVGETIVRAYHASQPKPSNVSLRSWLLTLETRTAQDLATESNQQKRWSVSFDENIPDPIGSPPDESFWHWHAYADHGVAMDTDVAIDESNHLKKITHIKDLVLDTSWLTKLRSPQWRAWLLHEVHNLSLSETAAALHQSTVRVTELIRDAWSARHRSPEVHRDE